MIVGASLLMILGALLISVSAAPARERASCADAISRECGRYGLDFRQCVASQSGAHAHGERSGKDPLWDFAIIGAAVAAFIWLGWKAARPPLALNLAWTIVLCGVMLLALAGCGWELWKRTRFS